MTQILTNTLVVVVVPTWMENAVVPVKAVVMFTRALFITYFAGIPKNIKPGTPPQLGLQVIQQYLQQPDVQQRFQQDQPFRERLEARAKQYQFQLQQQQNAVIGRLGAQMPGPMPATTST